jgi:hypothetical protein
MLVASQGQLLCTKTRRLQNIRRKVSLNTCEDKSRRSSASDKQGGFWNAPIGRPLACLAHVGGVGLFMHTSSYQDLRGNRVWTILRHGVAKDFGGLRKVLRCRWEWWFATMIRIVWHVWGAETWRKTSAKSRNTGAISRKTGAKSKSVPTHALNTRFHCHV